jgi:hypothetical protein
MVKAQVHMRYTIGTPDYNGHNVKQNYVYRSIVVPFFTSLLFKMRQLVICYELKT